MVRANTIRARAIDADTITADEIQANAITTDTLAANAVTTEKLAAGSVTAEIVDTDALQVGNVAVAAIQAVLLGVGLGLAGLPAVIFLTVATFVLTLLPLVGAFGVWVPATVYLLANHLHEGTEDMVEDLHDELDE